MTDYLEEFFAGRPTDSSKDRGVHSISHDRWDKDDYEHILNEVREFTAAEHQLSQIGGELAPPLMADEFWSLLKALVDIKPEKEIRPSFKISAAVMAEQMKLLPYESLRAHSTGDPVASAFAGVTMEPHLEIILDKLKKERDMAKALEGMLQKYEDLEAEAKALGEFQPVNYQEMMENIEGEMSEIRQAIEQGDLELAEALAKEASMIRAQLARGLKEANDQAERQENLSLAWGLDPGEVKRMPVEERLELAKRMDNEKFRRLADIVGPMMRLAWGEQQRKVLNVPEEIFDVGLGNDLPKMLPSEFAYLHSPILRVDWMRRYLDHALMQYELQGTETLAKGGIIFCEDGSGSMAGDREAWAKAVGLALLHIARAQKRPFTGIHFGSATEIRTFDFDFENGISAYITDQRHGIDGAVSGMESVVQFAEIFFDGGTDFVTPLSEALLRLQAQHAATGAVEGDIVFVTDGQCGVPEKWMQEFLLEKERLQFRMFGIVIGGSSDSEPLHTLCGGKVIELRDLHSGGDIKDIFRSV